MNKKIVTFTIAMVLLLGVTLGVTFALFTAQTSLIKNTFVAGKFGDLTLIEHQASLKADGTAYELGQQTTSANTYNLIPGVDIAKDPTVTFTYKADDEQVASYVYVAIKTTLTYDSEADTFSNDSITINLADAFADVFALVSGIADQPKGVYVFAKQISQNLPGTPIIKDNTIEVADTLTDVGEGFTFELAAYAAQLSANTDSAATVWENAGFDFTVFDAQQGA